eukprot:s779_g14.t1
MWVEDDVNCRVAAQLFGTVGLKVPTSREVTLALSSVAANKQLLGKGGERTLSAEDFQGGEDPEEEDPVEHDDCVDDLDPPKTPAKPHAKMPLAESSEEEAQARQASLEEPKEQENDAQKDGQSGRKLQQKMEEEAGGRNILEAAAQDHPPRKSRRV